MSERIAAAMSILTLLAGGEGAAQAVGLNARTCTAARCARLGGMDPACAMSGPDAPASGRATAAVGIEVRPVMMPAAQSSEPETARLTS